MKNPLRRRPDPGAGTGDRGGPVTAFLQRVAIDRPVPFERGQWVWLGCVAAIAGVLAAVLAVAVYPGGMTKDSYFQLAQARGSVPFNDWHPVVMSVIWRALIALTGSIGAMAVAQIAVAWLVAVLLSWFLLAASGSRIVSLGGLLVLVLPNSVNILGTVWKDTQMALALGLAVGCLLLARMCRGGRSCRVLLGTAFAALVYATLVRKNAVLAVLPLLLLASVLFVRLRGAVTLRRAAATGAAALAVLGGAVLGIGSAVSAATGATSNSQFTQVMLDDLIFAVPPESIAASEKAPPELVGKLAVARAECREKGVIWDAYWDCYGAGANGRGFTAIEHVDEVSALWFEQIPRHLPEYIRYRLMTTGELLSTSDLEFVITAEDAEHGVPPAAPELDRGLAAYVMGAAEGWGAWLFRGWFWLVLGVAGCAIALSRWRPSPTAGMIFLSGILYLAGFFPTAPAADYRYICWSALSVVIGGLVLLAEMVRDRRAARSEAAAAESPEAG